MGFKYEVETWHYESEQWGVNYRGNSLIKALLALRGTRRRSPERAYRMVIR